MEKEMKYMKEKTIIVCAGRLMIKNLPVIKEIYEIVALADNNKRGKMIEGYQCIGIDEIQSFEYDKIIICSVQYACVLREQLINEGIAGSRIYDIDSLSRQLYYNNDIQRYQENKKEYIDKCKNKNVQNFLYQDRDEYPILSDYRENAGSMDLHYFLMDIKMAKEVIKRKPHQHFDIGSRIDGFISHLMVHDIDISVIDIRPLPLVNPGAGIRRLDFIQGDATNLEKIEDHSIQSLSALHCVEHFGLGRYGDDIDPEAYIKCIRSMQRVLRTDGYLYFAVPVGVEEKLCFNAHRIFSPRSVLEYFKELTLEKMWLLHDMQFYEYSFDELKAGKYNNVIGTYDCGLYIFRKDVLDRKL